MAGSEVAVVCLYVQLVWRELWAGLGNEAAL